MHANQMGIAHPFDAPIKLWWGRREADDPLGPKPSRVPASLFDPVEPGQMYRAGGFVDENGVIERGVRTSVHEMISGLAKRMNEEKKRLGDVGFNDDVPSGYAYLLQLVAHDMTHSVVASTVRKEKFSASFENARGRALRLDTVYGAGPEERPGAYSFGQDQRDGRGQIPRVHLRIGPWTQESPDLPATAFCPRRDIARGERPRSTDAARDEFPLLLTEPQLADARNDSHAINSQLVVLFQLLHNHVYDRLNEQISIAQLGKRESSYRLFLCARSIVELIYRNIIEKDVLPKILDHRILDRYRRREPLWTSNWRGAPLEFSFGAFRFAHSIVRDSYLVNSALREPASMGSGLLRSSERSPSEKPLTPNWIVDWVNFFALDGKPRNVTRRIGPHLARDLAEPDDFPPKVEGLDAPGLASRDLLSACFAGLLSTPFITAKLQGVFGDALIPNFSTWSSRIEEWLGRLGDAPIHSDRIVEDPPLPFFVMFEAQYSAESDDDFIPVPHSNTQERIAGKRLGPVGSAIVAETMYAALANASFDFEKPAISLTRRIAICASALLQRSADEALEGLGGIESMAALLRFLKERRLFEDPDAR